MPRIYKAASNWTGQIGSGGVPDATTTTIPLASASGLVDGEWYIFSIDRVDANGNKTPAKWEVCAGQLSGTNFINCQRGVEGTAQPHSVGAIVEILFTATHWNELKAWLETDHNADGTHGDIAATSITTTNDATIGGKVSTKNIELTNQSSTPATPPAGKSVVYVKSDGYLYYLDENGVERRYYPPIVDNNVAYSGKDSSGVIRQVAKINGSNKLEIGGAGLSGISLLNSWSSSVQPACILKDNDVDRSITYADGDWIKWDGESYDPLDMHSTTTNTERITVPEDGIYLIAVSIRYITSSAGTNRTVSVFRNGTDRLLIFNKPVMSGADFITGAMVWQLNAGDYIALKAGHDVGSPIAIDGTENLFAVIKLF